MDDLKDTEERLVSMKSERLDPETSGMKFPTNKDKLLKYFINDVTRVKEGVKLFLKPGIRNRIVVYMLFFCRINSTWNTPV